MGISVKIALRLFAERTIGVLAGKSERCSVLED
jgi:hypothetical protein